MSERIPLLVLTGPTACGKRDVGLLLAERLGAELLSLDSMAVYRGMDIGTAKPSAEDRERVPHHLIDLCEPTESFSTGRYVRAAEAALAGVVGRGGVPPGALCSVGCFAGVDPRSRNPAGTADPTAERFETGWEVAQRLRGA